MKIEMMEILIGEDGRCIYKMNAENAGKKMVYFTNNLGLSTGEGFSLCRGLFWGFFPPFLFLILSSWLLKAHSVKMN